MGPSISSTLVRLNDWVASIQSGRFDVARITNAGPGPAPDLIENIAESLIKNASGTERTVLSKALQETLFYCVGFDTEFDSTQLKTRLMRYLDRKGTSSISQLFLSLYFFNFVWFEIGESFRALAWTPDEFEKDMEGVENACQKAVASIWKSFERTHQQLDLTAARRLVRDIEQQLRGSQVSDSG